MRLLILACSATKAYATDRRAIPAIYRYDGPMWRTLRAWLEPGESAAYARKKEQIDIYAISAKYGILMAYEPITHYDWRMDEQRAHEIREQWIGFDALEQQAACIQRVVGGYTHTLIAGGRWYQSVVAPIRFQHDRYGHVERTSGGIGEQLAQLKHWLHTEY